MQYCIYYILQDMQVKSLWIENVYLEESCPGYLYTEQTGIVPALTAVSGARERSGMTPD